MTEHWTVKIIKTSRALRRIAIKIRPRLALESQTMQSPPAGRPKILKERHFVHIGEFNSGSKRATRGPGGMRATGAGATESLTARSSAASSPVITAAGALFEV